MFNIVSTLQKYLKVIWRKCFRQIETQSVSCQSHDRRIFLLWDSTKNIRDRPIPNPIPNPILNPIKTNNQISVHPRQKLEHKTKTKTDYKTDIKINYQYIFLVWDSTKKEKQDLLGNKALTLTLTWKWMLDLFKVHWKTLNVICYYLVNLNKFTSNNIDLHLSLIANS